MTDLARVFKALGDPTRLAIFDLVRECAGEGCSEDDAADSLSKIADRFGLSLSTVSHHVKELRNAGLIHCEKQGQSVYCWPDQEMLGEVERYLQGVRV